MENRELNVEVKLIEDGILCSEWPLHAMISRESMEDETAQRIILCKESHSLLLKLHGIKLITDDAWNIISGDYFRSITTALAIVYDQESGYYEHGKIMVDLRFIQGLTVNYPVRFFDDESAGFAWLRAFNEIK